LDLWSWQIASLWRRLRATAPALNGVPSELPATYYAQRASAGLIVTEATQISPMGKGYVNTPGIHSPQQVQAWSRIVESVHESGGRILLQLWHVGRISHISLLPNNAQPVAPSAIRANSQTFIATGLAQVSEPGRLDTEVTEKVLEVWDEKGIGVRISQTGTFNDMRDADPSETFGAAVERLNKFRIGYLHVAESSQDGPQNNFELPWLQPWLLPSSPQI
jgi:2,4-dienoyl-CoA reductase-like NADH-dependent reductase (Old Yellow Enzyme family)